MAKLTPFLIAVAAVAAFGACSAPQQRTPTIVTSEMPYRPGTGVVQAVTPTPALSGSSSSEPLNRLHIRMDNGSMQYVDTVSSINKGARVQLTEDRQIRLM